MVPEHAGDNCIRRSIAVTNFADRTIWTGDNLDILRGLNSASVDLIYLDPPFNSNRNYAAPVGSTAAGAAFKDTWTLSDLDVAWMGLIADAQPAMYQVLQTAGLTHGKGMQSYLCMMAVRLLEMRRVLKDTGSIYLHCDPTAGHYLKLLTDTVFGSDKFKNEIVWKRTGSHGGSKRWGPVHDTILFYSASDDYLWNRVYQEYEADYLERHYRLEDENGRYQLVSLTGAGTRSGKSGQPWRGVDPTGSGRHWAVPNTALQAAYPEMNLGPLSTQEKLDLLDQAGLVYWPERGSVPRQKRYADESVGVPIQDIVTDIAPIGAQARERIGYPTQKPLALLERIIKASSNERDVVLDPFCGCATACVAAENLGRRWIGIDISLKAVELVNMRLQQSMGDLFHNRLVTARTDIPRRTDIDAPVPYRQNKHVLFGQQEGRCNGCRSEFPFRILEVDHIIPQRAGGQDNIENLQLLCAHCNRVKGDRPQEYLVARLRKLGIAA